MLYAMLAACCSLILVLAPRAAEARREARLFRAQEKWAEMMDATKTDRGTSPISIVCL